VCFNVKDIRRAIFLGNLLFMGIDSEIQWEGGWVEVKETDLAHVAEMATFNKQKHLQFPVHRNLLIRLCVRILTFLAYCISDSCSAIQIIYLDEPTNQNLTPLKSSAVLSQSDTCHWNISAILHLVCECLKSISTPQNYISKRAATRVILLSLIHSLLRLFLYLIQLPRFEVHLK